MPALVRKFPVQEIVVENQLKQLFTDGCWLSLSFSGHLAWNRVVWLHGGAERSDLQFSYRAEQQGVWGGGERRFSCLHVLLVMNVLKLLSLFPIFKISMVIMSNLWKHYGSRSVTVKHFYSLPVVGLQKSLWDKIGFVLIRDWSCVWERRPGAAVWRGCNCV